MQRYTIFFITANVLHVSDGFSAHHQEFKTVHTASSMCQACLLLPLSAFVSWFSHLSLSYVQDYLNFSALWSCNEYLPE